MWRLKLIGFHYSHSRGEYVLRLVGERFGPVYRPVHNGRWSPARCQAQAALDLD